MTDMLRVGGEYINKETKLEDVDYNYLKQLLKYMFAKVHVEFEDLLVLAADYQVGQLVQFCGAKIMETLDKEVVEEDDLYIKVRSF